MIESAKSENDVSLEASIPDGAVPLNRSFARKSCIVAHGVRPITRRRIARSSRWSARWPTRRAPFCKRWPRKSLEVLQADSAGLSLLTKDDKRFYWAAIAGAWQPYIGGGTPRDFGPCGDVLDCNVPMLFTHWERRYPYLQSATPLAAEGLLVPFYVKDKSVGTIWAIAHHDRHKFDAEDLRLLESLGRFASAAYQTVASIDDLKFQIDQREKAEAEVRELARGLEAKIRRLLEANVVGIVGWNFDGAITAANDAFLHMVQYDREDLASGRMRWTDLTPAEWRDHDERAISDLKATGSFQPYEKEYFRKDGSRVTVLLGGTLFEERGNDEGVDFVLDLTDQKRAEESLRKTQSELAHVTRVMTMGELAASIAHEVNQPLAAIVANGSACLRWLMGDSPNLGEARETAQRIIRDGKRASDIISRIRGLVRKTDPEKTPLDINQAVREVINLTQSEAVGKGVALRTELASELPFVLGDRVQLQQVILNLVMNGIEAMNTVTDRPREMLIRSSRARIRQLLVAVQDSGVGIDAQHLEKIFDHFLHHQITGHGDGTGDQPLDCSESRRAAMGRTE